MRFFQFEDPWLLLFFLIVPYLAIKGKGKELASINYSSLEILQTVRSAKVEFLSILPLVLRLLAVSLIVLALARPQEGQKSTEILSVGVDIMLALDTSGSMQALDFIKDEKRDTRLAMVKDVVSQFIENRPNDRMGMVVFGSEAYTQCPLTLDQGILQSFLSKLDIGMAGDSTAIGSAIGIAVKRLKDLESDSKLIILLTDGRNNAGNLPPLQAAQTAKAFGIKIHTIAVGTDGKAPFLVNSIFGQRYVYQEVDIDEETLKEISEITGGQYFRATDLESLKAIYKQIDEMEKSEVKVIDHAEYTELFHYFLIPGLLLLVLEVVLSNTFMRRIP
ncbi:MAG: VWA domain-containing protein [Nitrospina sp.]|jgi:Ca-activated chloride channel family protein|nr:VWA domain-containing protein [Nitrospina sp.]MBT6717999.1 VWA domain-containing protein [Nitrospina sp.]